MPAIIAKFEEKYTEAADAVKYAGILTGSLDSIKSLFGKLDVDSSGTLEKAELKEVVSKYNGEAFNEAQFFGWFDTHGVCGRPCRQRRRSSLRISPSSHRSLVRGAPCRRARMRARTASWT